MTLAMRKVYPCTASHTIKVSFIAGMLSLNILMSMVIAVAITCLTGAAYPITALIGYPAMIGFASTLAYDRFCF